MAMVRWDIMGFETAATTDRAQGFTAARWPGSEQRQTSRRRCTKTGAFRPSGQLTRTLLRVAGMAARSKTISPGVALATSRRLSKNSPFFAVSPC